MTTFLAGQILTADLLNVEDTGWVNVTIAGGFAAAADHPQVRRIGNVVYMQGGWLNTGISTTTNYTVGTVPVGFRPTVDLTFAVGSSTAAALASGFVTAAGSVLLRTSGTLGGYYRYTGLSWLID